MHEDVYLGDGLYAAFDGWQIELYASNGRNKTNQVYLEPAVLGSFLRFVDTLGGATMIYTAVPTITEPARLYPAHCEECDAISQLYLHPKLGLLCEEHWPKCERFGCNEMYEPDSVGGECLAHALESLADEIKDTPLSERVREKLSKVQP